MSNSGNCNPVSGPTEILSWEEMMKYNDLVEAFYFSSADMNSDNIAYISRRTGQTYRYSSESEINELPRDVRFNDDYIQIPSRNALELGRDLVWHFVAKECPRYKETVRAYFKTRGPYKRYKLLLSELELLHKWYKFEDEQTRTTLLDWCAENGIPVEDEFVESWH